MAREVGKNPQRRWWPEVKENGVQGESGSRAVCCLRSQAVKSPKCPLHFGTKM